MRTTKGQAALTLLLALTPAVALPAQNEGRAAIVEKRVGEIVNYLASDELAGRDTPSRGLDLAAKFLAKEFEKAGLKPGGDAGSYFHSYQRDGFLLRSEGIEFALELGGGKSKKLVPGKDFRLYAVGGAYKRDSTEVIQVAERDADRRLRRARPRKPVLIAVSVDSQLWKWAEGERQTLASQWGGPRAPYLLVRESLLPAPATKTAVEEGEEGEEEGEEEEEGLRISLEVPAPEEIQCKLKNVVAILPGESGHELAEDYVLFSAHYDHLGVRLPRRGDAIYNGADDDATGTTAVLVLAEAYARRGPLPRSLAFVCFSGEEKGMLGSRAFAKQPPIPLESIAVDLNIEMIGRPNERMKNAVWITGRDLSDFEDIAKVGLERAGIKCVSFRMAAMLFGGSDNISLARRGVVAHSISAGPLHRDYHQPTDEAERLDLSHMTAVIRGIYEAGLEFASRKERPAYNEKGQRLLRLNRKQKR